MSESHTDSARAYKSSPLGKALPRSSLLSIMLLLITLLQVPNVQAGRVSRILNVEQQKKETLMSKL